MGHEGGRAQGVLREFMQLGLGGWRPLGERPCPDSLQRRSGPGSGAEGLWTWSNRRV